MAFYWRELRLVMAVIETIIIIYFLRRRNVYWTIFASFSIETLSVIGHFQQISINMGVKYNNKPRSAFRENSSNSKRKLIDFMVAILWDFGLFTSLHGAKNLVNDFRYLNKPSTRAKFSNRLEHSFDWFKIKIHFSYSIRQQAKHCKSVQCRYLGRCVFHGHCVCNNSHEFDLAAFPINTNNYNCWNELLSNLECSVPSHHTVQY